MIVSVAFLAPSEPPETGASTQPAPCSASRAAKPRVASGEIVEQSMTSPPEASPDATPSAPNRTASTSGVSETQVTTTSALRPTSAGVAASRQPIARRSAALPGVRFQTVDLEPRLAQVAGHVLAHGAQPAEPDPFHALLRVVPLRVQAAAQVGAHGTRSDVRRTPYHRRHGMARS